MTKNLMKIMTVVMVLGMVFCFIVAGHANGAEKSVEERIKSLEQSIKKLEEANKALERQAQRAQDVIDIQNLQARYCAIHNSQEQLSWMLFADRPDTSKEITMEKIIGFDNIKASYLRMGGMMEAGASSGTGPSGIATSSAATSGAVSAGAGIAGGFPAIGGSTKPRYGVAHIHRATTRARTGSAARG